MAGTIVGISEGAFARSGLNLSLVPGSGDSDAIAAVVADENTIGIASAAGFLKARAEGRSIVAFGGTYAVSPVAFFVLADTKLLQPSDLQGKRIGYRSGPELSTILEEFVVKNSLPQSALFPIATLAPVQDLIDRKIDVLLGRLDIEGQELAHLQLDYKTLSPGSYGVHAAAPLYFAQERAFAKRRNLEEFLLATAVGWTAAYGDYEGTIPIINRAIDVPLSRKEIWTLMDALRGYLRPFGARFGELDERRIHLLHAQLLGRRMIDEPVDLTRAINYDVLKGAYRSQASRLSGNEP